MRPLAAHPYRHVREVTPWGLKRKQSLRIDLQKSQMYFLSQKYITFVYNNVIIQIIQLIFPLVYSIDYRTRKKVKVTWLNYNAKSRSLIVNVLQQPMLILVYLYVLHWFSLANLVS